MDKESLTNRAGIIRDAIKTGENSAHRVGTLLVDMIDQIAETDSTAETAKETATTATEEAETAKTIAGNAKTAADNAKSTANTAKSTADDAKKIAGDAKILANSANGTATAAKTAADQAVEDAANAVEDATTAKADAATAKADAATAKAQAFEVVKFDYAGEPSPNWELQPGLSATGYSPDDEGCFVFFDTEKKQFFLVSPSPNGNSSLVWPYWSNADTFGKIISSGGWPATSQNVQPVAHRIYVADESKFYVWNGEDLVMFADLSDSSHHKKALDAAGVKTFNDLWVALGGQLTNASNKPYKKGTTNLTYEEAVADLIVNIQNSGVPVSQDDVDKWNAAAEDADDAKTIADNAASVASIAKTKAETAIASAETAISTASTAISSANTAKSLAETATSTANTAKSTADTAKSTADTAKALAQGASNDLDAAKISINTEFARVNTKITTLESKVTSVLEGAFDVVRFDGIVNNPEGMQSEDATQTESTDNDVCVYFNSVTKRFYLSVWSGQAYVIYDRWGDADRFGTYNPDSAYFGRKPHEGRIYYSGSKYYYFDGENLVLFIDLSDFAKVTQVNTAASIAFSAKTTAESAESTAESAATLASTAKTTAETAKTTADDAKTEIDNAKAKLDQIGSGFTVSSDTANPTDIGANVTIGDGVEVHYDNGTTTFGADAAMSSIGMSSSVGGGTHVGDSTNIGGNTTISSNADISVSLTEFKAKGKSGATTTTIFTAGKGSSLPDNFNGEGIRDRVYTLEHRFADNMVGFRYAPTFGGVQYPQLCVMASNSGPIVCYDQLPEATTIIARQPRNGNNYAGGSVFVILGLRPGESDVPAGTNRAIVLPEGLNFFNLLNAIRDLADAASGGHGDELMNSYGLLDVMYGNIQ